MISPVGAPNQNSCTVIGVWKPPELMKIFILSLLVLSAAFAQMPSVPCIAPPTPPPANAANQAPRPGQAPRRTPPAPLSAGDTAEIAKLMDLPAWGQNLSDGDYSHGPAYPTAPELAKRTGVPEGKVVEFVMNSAESKFYPGIKRRVPAARLRLCSG